MRIDEDKFIFREHKDRSSLTSFEFVLSERGESFEASSEAEGKSRGDVLEERLIELSDRWVTLASAYFEAVPRLSFMGHVLGGLEASGDLFEYAEKKALKIDYRDEEGDGGRDFLLPKRELNVLLQMYERKKGEIAAAHSMGKATLGGLLSEYEAFISELIDVVTEFEPSAIVSDSDKISLRDLMRFSDIKDARISVRKAKIDELIMGKSHKDVLAWIGEKFGVNLLSDNKIIYEFVEVCQRRHLLTHAGGKVNSRYILKCTEAGYPEEKLPSEGEDLVVGRQYLRRATSRVFQIGLFSLHLIFQKLIPHRKEKSFQILLDASHHFLNLDLTKTCRNICDFALKKEKVMSRRHSTYFFINRAQSIAFDPDIERDLRDQKLKEYLATRDLGFSPPVIKLALSCLQRDFEDLLGKLTRAADDGLTYENAQTWNIFREIRSRDEFLEVFS